MSGPKISAAPMFNKSLLGLDIWNEILGYFEVSLEKDGEKVVKEKRKAMLAIALLSPRLTELALDALWKNMTTLVPIVNIANTDGKCLRYRKSNGRGCWRISTDLETTDKLLDDLIKILKRVRSLYVKVNGKELELWQMLHTILAPRSMMYILPCLQNISLISADTTRSHPFLGVISCIFAPSLMSITVSGCWGASWSTVQYYMNLHDLPNLSQLLYFDETLDDFPRGIGRLTGLQNLTLHDEGQFYTFSVLEYLAPLCCLEKLTISITLIDDTKDPSTVSVTLPMLQHLHLKSETKETFDLFFRQVQLPSLTYLSLGIRHDLTQELPLGLIVASYPNLLHLILQCAKAQNHLYKIAANDLESIVNLCGLKSLELVNIPHKLGWRDILSLVQSLPDLYSLAITGPGIIFSAKLLILISKLSNLRRIELPLDLTPLMDHKLSDRTSESPSQLRKIISNYTKGIPDNSSEKVVLIRKLLHLFPKLEEFGGAAASMTGLKDLFRVVNKMFKPSMVIKNARKIVRKTGSGQEYATLIPEARRIWRDE
ncbi:hypothetical protein AGABI2DRAFT_121007 [Agaricus bisporus var. bisporus H97]|uniref:hypothetical protein n=1 Tax=Agaricus bisporus var. bisporus (strain H97 / ATCC MYA-4626 / FGSC 10389) TaxID=936046 RepID=UPI00029F5A2B|nr:hypothetical protein AGABI2DRAFT_121007 [Agaricus bisporus var. bisporus H97]EKV43793.1 hypothetical protein AGABI2DRAFT_121007 [Agaricus bisporus var. bisporus H97]